jgi:hypothetical protein
VDSLVRALLAASPPPGAETLAAWRAATAPTIAAFTLPIDRALVAAAHADRLAFAFAAGYTEALRALVPTAADAMALCATEAGGNHPRAIQTQLTSTPAGHRLTGRKVWATGANTAASLLVVASTGIDATGTNRLRVVRVPATAPGVRIAAAPAPFVPEIEHATIELTDVAIADADILPGDGYADYLKPFRTVEDAHVHAALAAYLLGVAHRHGWREYTERMLALALATRTVATAEPKLATTHLALAGVLALAAREVADLEAHWAAAIGAGETDAEYTRWLRDRRLLETAAKARAARRERAWEQLG